MARPRGVRLDPPLTLAHRARADVWRAWLACRQALVRMRNAGYRVRLLEEDEPLFLAAELEREGSSLLATAELLPAGDGCELELRLEGEAPRTGFAALLGDDQRAVAALERALRSRLEDALGRRVLDRETVPTFGALRAALEDTRERAAHRRARRAEVESAFAAGLIDAAERARLLDRLG